jgi:hypothetical protein
VLGCVDMWGLGLHAAYWGNLAELSRSEGTEGGQSPFWIGNPAGLPGASLQQCSRAQAAVAAAEASRRNRAQCQPAHCPHPYTPHDAGSSSCCIQAIRSHSFAGTTPPTRTPGEKRSEGPKLWNHLSLRSLAPLPGLYASGSGLQ